MATTREDRLEWALKNIRLSAAVGLSFGHGATPQTPEKMVERKDFRLRQIIAYCSDVGLVGSILRDEKGVMGPEDAD